MGFFSTHSYQILLIYYCHAIAMIQMYFKHLEMKMALTAAVNVYLVLHCNDYAKRRLLIIQVQACLSGRSMYKVILDMMFSLPAVASHGNFSPYHYQHFQSPDHMAEKFEPILQMRDWGEKKLSGFPGQYVACVTGMDVGYSWCCPQPES